MAKAVIDLQGQRFARLFVLSFAGIRNHRATWLCLCDCGQRTTTEGKKLREGHTRSCGCLQRSKAAARFRRHGMFYSRTHKAWSNMRVRCLNKKSKDYPNYGGRGIVVCSQWLGSFENFLADMGICPRGLELDRINTNGNYEPGNCRWTDEATQARNRRTREEMLNGSSVSSKR